MVRFFPLFFSSPAVLVFREFESWVEEVRGSRVQARDSWNGMGDGLRGGVEADGYGTGQGRRGHERGFFLTPKFQSVH